MTIAVIIINNDSLYKVGARDRKGGGDRKITQSENLAPNRHEMDEAAVKYGENEAIKESTKWLNKEWKAFQI